MSTLLLVRHGQATLGGDDYDLLSPLGHEQAAALGSYWVKLGLTIDRVLIGPRRRHRETHAAVKKAFLEADLPWPQEEKLDALDEHQGPEVLTFHRDRLNAEMLDHGSAEGARTGSAAADGPDRTGTDGASAAYPDLPGSAGAMREYLRLFRYGSLRWARNELPTPDGLEDWTSFRARIATGLESIRNTTSGGQVVAAFTSGGAVSAATGHVLGLDDEQIMRMSWRVRNAAITEMQLSQRGYGLTSFNAQPHFHHRHHLTFV